MAGRSIEIEPGGRGQFDVFVEGELIYSKHQTGRFPTPQEIEASLKARP